MGWELSQWHGECYRTLRYASHRSWYSLSSRSVRRISRAWIIRATQEEITLYIMWISSSINEGLWCSQHTSLSNQNISFKEWEVSIFKRFDEMIEEWKEYKTKSRQKMRDTFMHDIVRPEWQAYIINRGNFRFIDGISIYIYNTRLSRRLIWLFSQSISRHRCEMLAQDKGNALMKVIDDVANNPHFYQAEWID